MKFSALKSILSDTWQIDISTFNQYYPIFKNILNGGTFEVEPESESTIPFMADRNGKKSNNSGDVGVLQLRGIMLKHDGVCGEPGMRTLGNRMRQMAANPDINSIVLIVESGGGQSSAVAEVTEAMREINKPVVIWVDGIMASAAMYVGSYANYIYASRKTDFIGSIGTMIEWQAPPKQSTNSNGDVYVRVYADGSEEKNNAFEEAINNANFTPVKEKLLNPVNKQFHKDIKANRPNVTEKQLKGDIFEAKEVVGSLIDEIGTFEQAVKKAYNLGKSNTKNQISNNQTENNMKIKLSEFPLIGKLFAKQEVEEVEMTAENLTAIEAKTAEMQGSLNAANDSIATLTTEKETAVNKATELEAENTTLKNELEARNAEIITLNEKLKAAPTKVEKVEDPALQDEKVIKTKNELAAEENAKAIFDNE